MGPTCGRRLPACQPATVCLPAGAAVKATAAKPGGDGGGAGGKLPEALDGDHAAVGRAAGRWSVGREGHCGYSVSARTEPPRVRKVMRKAESPVMMSSVLCSGGHVPDVRSAGRDGEAVALEVGQRVGQSPVGGRCRRSSPDRWCGGYSRAWPA